MLPETIDGEKGSSSGVDGILQIEPPKVCTMQLAREVARLVMVAKCWDSTPDTGLPWTWVEFVKTLKQLFNHEYVQEMTEADVQSIYKRTKSSNLQSIFYPKGERWEKYYTHCESVLGAYERNMLSNKLKDLWA